MGATSLGWSGRVGPFGLPAAKGSPAPDGGLCQEAFLGEGGIPGIAPRSDRNRWRASSVLEQRPARRHPRPWTKWKRMGAGPLAEPNQSGGTWHRCSKAAGGSAAAEAFARRPAEGHTKSTSRRGPGSKLAECRRRPLRTAVGLCRRRPASRASTPHTAPADHKAVGPIDAVPRRPVTRS